MTQTRQPDLISPDRLPHTALRTAELYLKRQTFHVERRTVRRLYAFYVAAYADIRAVAQDSAEALGIDTLGDPAASLWRERALSAARQRVAGMREAVISTAFQAASAALVGNYYGRLWLLDVATREGVRVNMPPLNAEGMLHEDVYSDLIRSLLGREWREQYALELDDLEASIRRAIGDALVNGESVPQAMRRVRQAMGVTTDRRRGRIGSAERRTYRQNFNRVQTITRTVINRVSSEGAISAYKANKDILSGYQWLTAHDERTCPQCRGLDGKVYPFRSRVRPPAHPNCRCTLLPVLKADALEDGDRKPRASFKAWAGGVGMDAALTDFLK